MVYKFFMICFIIRLYNSLPRAGKFWGVLRDTLALYT